MSDTKTMQMQLISTNVSSGEFSFDMQAKSNAHRTVRFNIDLVDSRSLYEALHKFLNK